MKVIVPTLNHNWMITYTVLAVSSMIFSLIIPLMYYFHPRTRQHPNFLLVLICLSEITEVYHLLLIVYQFKLERFAYNPLLYFFFGVEIDFYFMFCIINMMFYQLAIFLQQFFYIAWCVELILTLKRPFLSTKLRMVIYIPMGFLFTAVQSQMNLDTTYDQCYYHLQVFVYPEVDCFSYRSIAQQVFFYLVAMITIIISCMAIYTAQKIQDKTIRTIKIRYLKQQVISLFLVLLLWIGPTIGVLAYFNQDRQYTIYHLDMALVCCQGSVLVYYQEQFLGFYVYKNSILGPSCGQVFQANVFQWDNNSLTQIDAWNVPLSILLRTIQSFQVISGILKGMTKSLQANQGGNMSITEQIIRERTSMESPIDQHISHNLSLNSESYSNQQCLITDDETIQMKVVEYAPQVFAQLRQIDDIDSNMVEDSLSLVKNSNAINQITQSMGRSGSFFFFSYDKKLIIKTLKEGEVDFLISILERYTKYIKKSNNSLIARLYGCFAIQIENVAPVFLVLMENTFQKIRDPQLVFDLKGSLINRRTNDKQFGKDINFLESDQVFIQLESSYRTILMNQIKADSEFLRDINIMDYSLLLGIKYEKFNEDSFSQVDCDSWTSRLVSNNINNCQQSFSFAIIDYLQDFNYMKYLETKYKSLFNEEILISSVSPNQYSQRFIAFMNTIIISSFQY